MGKYSNLQDDIFSVFASVGWGAENIKTYPSNFLAVNPGTEFLRVSILPSREGLNLKSSSGLMMVDIFVPAGKGPTRANEISDKLDSYLVGKSLSTAGGVTQLTKSYLNVIGQDKDNPSLFRVTYTVPFNYFEVS